MLFIVTSPGRYLSSCTVLETCTCPYKTKHLSVAKMQQISSAEKNSFWVNFHDSPNVPGGIEFKKETGTNSVVSILH